jgi:hypothetical protein
MKLVSVLSRGAQATMHIAAATNADSVAIWAYRSASPIARGATETRTIRDIAEVGPIARCREEPNTA